MQTQLAEVAVKNAQGLAIRFARMEERWARCAMLLAGHSQAVVRKAINRRGSAAEWWASEEASHGDAALGPLFDSLEREQRLCESYGVRVLVPEDTQWPTVFDELLDPPPMVWLKGDSPAGWTSPGLAIVGARRATDYGRRMSGHLAEQWVALGGHVVSGGARGIDAEAHAAAVAAEGQTAVVMGTGLARLYPAENRRLFHEILDNGCWISELPMVSGVNPRLFPKRNRLIAALSCGVVVVQAGKRSGALHTARYANQMARPLFAVPANAGDSACEGSNQMLASGVPAALDALMLWKQIHKEEPNRAKTLKFSQPILPARPKVALSGLDKSLRICLDLIAQGGCHIDDLAHALNCSAGELSLLLLDLEFRGWVEKTPGNHYQCTVELER